MTSRNSYAIPQAPSGTRWTTVKEAAATLGISVRSVRRAISEGRLDVHRPNQRNKPIAVAVPLSAFEGTAGPSGHDAEAGDVDRAESVTALRIENAELKTRLSLVEGQLSDARDDLRAVENGRDALQSELIQLARQAQRGPLEKLLRAWRGT